MEDLEELDNSFFFFFSIRYFVFLEQKRLGRRGRTQGINNSLQRRIRVIRIRLDMHVAGDMRGYSEG